MSAVVGGHARLHDARLLLEATGEYRKMAGILALLGAEALGWPLPMSEDTARRHRSEAAKLGISSADLRFPHPQHVGLNFASGTVSVPTDGSQTASD